MSDVPWFVPGVAISFALGLALSGRAALAYGTRRAVGGALVVAAGIILSATLTPGREALEYGATGVASCDLTRIGLPSLADLVAVNETSLNVLLFVPLGAAIGMLPRSQRKAVVAVGAFAMPLAIELIQLLVLPFDRVCQSADVVDNLTGLVLGLVVGTLAGRRLTTTAQAEGTAEAEPR